MKRKAPFTLAARVRSALLAPLAKSLRAFYSWGVHFLKGDPVAAHSPNVETYRWEEQSMDTFLGRVYSTSGESMKMIYGFMKGIALTTATLVFMRMIVDANLGSDLPLNWWKLFMFASWFMSFGVLLITYEAPMFATTLLFELPPWWITTFPAIFTLCEFIAFAILSHEVFLEGLPRSRFVPYDLVTVWLIVNGVYHIMISWFCYKGLNYFGEMITRLNTSPFAEVIKTYRSSLALERMGTLFVGGISMISGLVLWKLEAHEPSTPLLVALGVGYILMWAVMGTGLRLQYTKRKETMKTFWEQHKKKPQTSSTSTIDPF